MLESIQAQLGHATAGVALRHARRRELKDSSDKLGHMVVPHLPLLVVLPPSSKRFPGKKHNGARECPGAVCVSRCLQSHSHSG